MKILRTAIAINIYYYSLNDGIMRVNLTHLKHLKKSVRSKQELFKIMFAIFNACDPDCISKDCQLQLVKLESPSTEDGKYRVKKPLPKQR